MAEPEAETFINTSDTQYVLAASCLLLNMLDRLPGLEHVRLAVARTEDVAKADFDPESANVLSVRDLAVKLAQICKADEILGPSGTGFNRTKAH